MPNWIGLLIALIVAVIALLYLPSPINWIVGLVLLIIVAAVALQGYGGGRRTL